MILTVPSILFMPFLYIASLDLRVLFSRLSLYAAGSAALVVSDMIASHLVVLSKPFHFIFQVWNGPCVAYRRWLSMPIYYAEECYSHFSFPPRD